MHASSLNDVPEFLRDYEYSEEKSMNTTVPTTIYTLVLLLRCILETTDHYWDSYETYDKVRVFWKNEGSEYDWSIWLHAVDIVDYDPSLDEYVKISEYKLVKLADFHLTSEDDIGQVTIDNKPYGRIVYSSRLGVERLITEAAFSQRMQILPAYDGKQHFYNNKCYRNIAFKVAHSCYDTMFKLKLEVEVREDAFH